MKVYLVAAAGSSKDSSRLADTARLCAEAVLFPESEPWNFRHWASRDVRTQLLVWSNEPDHASVLPPLRVDGERALGCPGYLGDPRDLERLLRADHLGALADQLPGVFGAFRAHQHGFVAVTTLTRFHPVYYASAGDFHVAGNRALLVHLVDRLLANASPLDAVPAARYDISSLQSLVRNGFFMSDDTPFEGVQALSPHSELEVLRSVRRIIQRSAPEPKTDHERPRTRRRLIRHLTDSVVKAVIPLRAFSDPVTLQLSGGRDSRLIAAALHAADIPFFTVTRGVREHPDVSLAARISELLGVEHRIATPEKEPKDGDLIVKHPLVRAWEIIRATEGMVSVHNNVATPTPFRTAPTIAGWGGEQLRGGYLPALFKASRTPSPSVMLEQLSALFTGHSGLLTDAANERASGDLAQWLERADPSPAQVLDHVYLYYRSGRWVSALGGAAWATRNSLNPLLDNLLTRYALAIPALVRWSELPVHQVISRLAPSLRNLPLTGTRWRYEGRKPLGPLRRRGWSSRVGLKAVGHSAGFEWRSQPSPALIDILREQILDGPPQLFDLIKRSEMAALLATYPLPSPKFVWHAYTASVLLSNRWLAARPDLPSIKITPPK